MLTRKDYEHQRHLNAKNDYGFSYNMLVKIGNQHQKAYSNNDEDTMKLIIYRLIDANYHPEAGLLDEHDYEGFKKLIYKDFHM